MECPLRHPDVHHPLRSLGILEVEGDDLAGSDPVERLVDVLAVRDRLVVDADELVRRAEERADVSASGGAARLDVTEHHATRRGEPELLRRGRIELLQVDAEAILGVVRSPYMTGEVVLVDGGLSLVS